MSITGICRTSAQVLALGYFAGPSSGCRNSRNGWTLNPMVGILASPVANIKTLLRLKGRACPSVIKFQMKTQKIAYHKSIDVWMFYEPDISYNHIFDKMNILC